MSPQSVVLAAIPKVDSVARLRGVAHHLLDKLFDSTPDLPRRCMELVLQTSPLPLTHLVLLSLIVTYQPRGGKRDTFISENYPQVVRLFCSTVLGSRVQPDHMVVGNMAGIFKKVTREIFKEHLLPAMLKALLRNPDELTKSKLLCGIHLRL